MADETIEAIQRHLDEHDVLLNEIRVAKLRNRWLGAVLLGVGGSQIAQGAMTHNGPQVMAGFVVLMAGFTTLWVALPVRRRTSA